MPRPAPIDSPDLPHKGLRVFTLRKDEYPADMNPTARWCLGTCHTVARVNGRSFYIYTDGRTVRRLLVEWRQWLTQLQGPAWTWLLWSEDDRRGWQPLRELPANPVFGTDVPGHTVSCALTQRDQRFSRARQQVLGRYRMERVDLDGQVIVRLEGGAEPYEVVTRLDGSEPPQCTCPDAVHRQPVHQGFCKHAIGVLLSWPDLRCQLLPAIL